MKLEDFDFDLPTKLIAQTPASPRDHARLLIYDRQTRLIADDYFYNLQLHLLPKTTLVLNNSKVEKCRLRFGNIEVFIIEVINPTTVRALVRPGKKFKLGNEIQLGPAVFKTLSLSDDGIRLLNISLPVDSKQLEQYRLTPLPPYIAQNESLADEYQTVYALPLGSKAAPTAGLHFTKSQIAKLAHNHPIAELTLHVGLGTFAPLKAENINNTHLHSERYQISSANAKTLNKAQSITAVGTTSCRTLESAGYPFKASSGSTDIFIKPGYRFSHTNSLVTNFHLPSSSLLMLVSALIGSVDEMQRVYAHAIGNNYRFYSFGDAMLIK